MNCKGFLSKICLLAILLNMTIYEAKKIDDFNLLETNEIKHKRENFETKMATSKNYQFLKAKYLMINCIKQIESIALNKHINKNEALLRFLIIHDEILSMFESDPSAMNMLLDLLDRQITVYDTLTAKTSTKKINLN